MGCTPSQIREGLESYRGIRWRLEPVSIGGIVVLNDAYNANPVSASIALETLHRWDNGRPHRRVAVLGDMLELGAVAEGEHYALGQAAGQAGLALLVAVGTWAATVGEGARQAGMSAGAVHTAADTRQAWQLLAPRLIEGDLVLLKGSRAVGLEGLVDLMQQEQGGASAAPGQEG
jgi:UDP-N-acetylmuramyl pentapeptide synthase